ncbi:MAG: Type II/IV secretion system protein TadC, associated with Flp pilus assembly, partial [uncultured Nocardioidaceae bacterium]
ERGRAGCRAGSRRRTRPVAGHGPGDGALAGQLRGAGPQLPERHASAAAQRATRTGWCGAPAHAATGCDGTRPGHRRLDLGAPPAPAGRTRPDPPGVPCPAGHVGRGGVRSERCPGDHRRLAEPRTCDAARGPHLSVGTDGGHLARQPAQRPGAHPRGTGSWGAPGHRGAAGAGRRSGRGPGRRPRTGGQAEQRRALAGARPRPGRHPHRATGRRCVRRLLRPDRTSRRRPVRRRHRRGGGAGHASGGGAPCPGGRRPWGAATIAHRERCSSGGRHDGASRLSGASDNNYLRVLARRHRAADGHAM